MFQKNRKVANVNLRGLPRGKFKVRIVVLTSEGKTLRGTRTYRTCTKKRKSKRPPKLVAQLGSVQTSTSCAG